LDIFCNNRDCKNFMKLKDPYIMKYHKAYVPIGTTGQYQGKCSIRPNFVFTQEITSLTKYIYVICLQEAGLNSICGAEQCLLNNCGICGRKEIGVNIKNGKSYCMNYSDKFISGHVDMMSSRFLNQKSHIPDPMKEI